MVKRKVWSNEEIKILKEKYPEMGTECSSLFIGRSKSSVKTKAIKLKLKFDGRDSWTDDEVEKLKVAWVTYDMETLLKTFPGRTYSKIMGKARGLKIKSETNRARKGSLDFLDTLTRESAYWWGFIMSDGHINTNDLVVGIHSMDFDHLNVLAKHLKTEVHHSSKKNLVVIRVGDKKFCSKWLNLLKIGDIPKTYSGIDFQVFEEYFTEFIIGFIDGDGHIRFNNKHKCCTVEIHKNWLFMLEAFSTHLKINHNIDSNVKSTKNDKYVRLTIQNKENMISLKSLCDNLPVLGRKWDKICS